MDFWGKRIIHFIEEKKYAGAMRNMALVLAVAVIFVTTYMLVLPAVTIDRDTAATEAGLVLEDTAKEEAEEADAEEAEAGEAEAAKTGEAEVGDTEADSEITADTGSDVAESGDTSESERQNRGDLPAAEAASGETAAKDPAESPAAAETGAEDTAVPEETAHQTAAAEETEPPAAAVGETEPQPAAGELTCELKDVFAGITYGPEANIPPGSTLSVKEIEEGTEEYDAARNAVLADKKEKGEFVDIGAFHLAALDISILDPDGKEIEPEAAVQVDLRIKDLPGIDDLDEIKDTLEIQHHVEAEDGVVVETVFDGKAEGAYSMDTDERIAAEGTAVDPDSVSDRDFGIRKEIRITAKPAVTDRDVSDEEMGITASFDTPLFSTFTITWERGAASNSTTTLRWRDGNSTRAYVTVHYYDQDGNAITRPSGIGNTVDTTISNTGNYNYAISGLAQAISGYTFDAAYRDSGLTQRITSITASRTYHNSYGGWYSSVVNFLNGNTSVENTDLGYNNSNAGDIYLIYRGPALEDSHTTVHYGYMNGTTFVEFEAQPAPVDPRTSHHTYLIYDFEGYQYAATDAEQYGGHTYYRTTEAVNGANMRSGATQIQARLAHNNANGWRYRETGTNSWTAVEDGSHIYVVYSRMPEATQGGTPTVKPSSAANPPANPSILKESASNHDGTNKLGLSIRSDTADLEVEKLADVIVVFDVSGSMSSDDMGDDESRLSSGRDAINALANKLLNKTNTSGDKLIRMGLITFSTDARVVQPLTDDEETFRAAVDRQTTANGGTNWEKALNLANQMSVDSGRATFVIFVTDGDPTFRVSRMDATDAELQGDLNSWDNNDTYYVSSNVFGQGSSDNQKRNYNAALKVAQSIIGNRKTFYTIGISSDVTHLNTFADDAGAAGKYTANNSEELTRAFDDIQASIVALMGWGDINMTDGITSLTNTVEKSGLTVTDGRFEYWKAPAPANWSSMTPEQKAAYRPAESDFAPWTPSAERAQEAVYEDGAVKWDMGHDFMPAAGVTYKVTFNAWPSQEAYDWIADLSNGTKTWSDVVAAGLDYPNGAMPQIVNNGDGTFSLKTNQPGANTTYRSATKSGEAVSTTGEVRNLDFNDVDPMPLAGEEMKVRKEWDDSVNTGHTAEALKFRLLVDGKYYQNDGTKTAEVGDPYVLEANTANSWTDTVDIAPGIVKIAADGTATVYETGHEYKIEEYDITGGTSYYDFSFEYTSQTVRPMVLNGTLTYLVKVEPPVYPAPDGADTFTIDGREYYAAAAGSGEGVLTGTNHKTSELDITKIVNAAEGSGKTAEELEEETFTYRVTLTFPEGANIDGITPYEYVPRIQDNAYTLYGYQTGETAFPSDIERFSGKTFRSWNTSNATVKSLTTTNADGTMTAVIDMTLKQTEVIRFTNLPTGTTYVIQEIYANKYGADTGSPNANKAPVSDPCNLTDKGYTITQVLSTNGTVRTTAVANDTVSGTISGMNTRYYNQFTNLYTAKPVRLVKVDPDRRELDGASFTLNKINVNGTPEQFRTGIVVGDTILSLPAGDYELVEEDSPDGYIILAAKVYFRMDALGHVTLLDPDTREAIEPEDDVSAVDPAELRYTEEDGFTLYVINTPGEVLPMTGGAGTTGFVIIGAILMIGAGVVLAARRRMSANE